MNASTADEGPAESNCEMRPDRRHCGKLRHAYCGRIPDNGVQAERYRHVFRLGSQLTKALARRNHRDALAHCRNY